MPEYPGTFIVLEGSDGSGKATQLKVLSERLKAVGYEIEIFDFPQYEQPSSHFVRRYLAGDYGPASGISPYSASLFYALDRFEAAPRIRQALDKGRIVLANRYVGSNMAHQGGKFGSEGEQRGFFIWDDGLEYQLLGIPRPSISLFLRLPAEVSLELMRQRSARSGKALDEHEADVEHLKAAVNTYDTLCRLFPKDFQAVNCAPEGKLLDIADINDLIWRIVKPLLPPKAPRPARGGVVYLTDVAAPVKTGSKKPAAKASPEPKATVSKSDKKPLFYIPKLEAGLGDEYRQTLNRIMRLRQSASGYTKEDPAMAGAFKGLTQPLAAMAASDGKLDLPLAKVTSKDGPDAVDALTLLESNPRNEFDLLDESAIDLPYEQKYLALQELLDNPSSTRLTGRVSYRWRAVTTQASLSELISSGVAMDLSIRSSAPNNGWQTPDSIAQSVLEADFNECFKLSEQLYRRLDKSRKANVGLYATLAGHLVVLEFSCDGLALRDLRPKNPEFAQLIELIKARIAEIHPLIAATIADTGKAANHTTRTKK